MVRRFPISGAACIGGALLVLVLPLPWLAAAVSAAAFHELCHYLAVSLTGGCVRSLSVTTGGALMNALPMPPERELICALAGPAGSFLLFLTYPVFPRTALWALVQGIYNMLPVYPMDGGRALYCALALLFPEDRAAQICRLAGLVTEGSILVTGVWAALGLKLGFAPIAISSFLLARMFLGKIPCIVDKLAVQ